MGGAVSAGESNDELIDNLLDASYIKNHIVERVFRAVDRGNYYTESHKENAYKDLAWKDGNLHLSAPCIYAKVLENLDLDAGLSFLNLGSGTGYLSTMAGLILGPNGVNHGIEYYDDVVEYAKEKLKTFLSTNTIIDEFEFCKPFFVVGNCLHLEKPVRTYDRVYCGAACHQNCEEYMKSLLNVSGVLIMPINEQLVKYVRVAADVWTTTELLPVSFANLLPATDPLIYCKLPNIDPLNLGALCRLSIRCCLREIIKKENPTLQDKKHKRKTKSKRRRLYNHSRRNPRMRLSDEQEESQPDNRPKSLDAEEAMKTDNLSDTSEDLDDFLNNSSGDENVANGCQAERPQNSESANNDESPNPVSTEPHRCIEPSPMASFLLVATDNERSFYQTILHRPPPNQSYWKYTSNDESDSAEEESDEDSSVQQTSPSKLPIISMSEQMQAKIQALPLPKSLKNFLNFNGALHYKNNC